MTAALQRTTLTQFETDHLDRLRVQFSGQPGFDEFIEEQARDMLLEPVPPACPVWCGLAEGHFYGSETDEAALVRIHQHNTGDLVSVCQEERLLPDGRVELLAPYVSTYTDNIEMDHDRAAAHGSAVLEAAAQLREIGGAA